MVEASVRRVPPLVEWAQQTLERLPQLPRRTSPAKTERAQSVVRAGLVIAGGHYQVLTQVPVVFDVPFPPIVREVLSWFDFINLPIVEMLRPECWSAAAAAAAAASPRRARCGSRCCP